jgi:hypothetical protein
MTAISNGQNVSAVVSFSQRIFGKKAKNNQLAAITLLKDKVDINKKSQKMILLKATACNISLLF